MNSREAESYGLPDMTVQQQQYRFKLIFIILKDGTATVTGEAETAAEVVRVSTEKNMVHTQIVIAVKRSKRVRK